MFATRNDLLYALVRIVAGGVIWSHGSQKMFGLFGGQGWEATVSGFEKGMGIPTWLGALVIIAECLGGAAMVLGVFTRFSAFWNIVVITVAALMVHAKNGFFSGDNGIELHLLYVTLALVTLVKGAGAFSIDRMIAQRMDRAPVHSFDPVRA